MYCRYLVFKDSKLPLPRRCQEEGNHILLSTFRVHQNLTVKSKNDGGLACPPTSPSALNVSRFPRPALSRLIRSPSCVAPLPTPTSKHFVSTRTVYGVIVIAVFATRVQIREVIMASHAAATLTSQSYSQTESNFSLNYHHFSEVRVVQRSRIGTKSCK